MPRVSVVVFEMTQRRPKVVIVGAGFAGLFAARAFDDRAVDVVVIDRSNHHLFQPLLYQVASAALNPSDIAMPIRHILRRQDNVTVLLGEVTRVDTASRQVFTADGPVEYDHLIVACGATHSYFGNDEWAEHAPGLKSLDDATQIRSRILYAFEAAERATSREEREAWLTFVVIGAGPTGVELAGALAEIAFRAVVPEFRRIDPRDARVLLLEGGDRVLPPYAEESSASAQRQLESLGVEVRTGTMVSEIDESGVMVGDDRVAARTVIWAAGVQASPLAAVLGGEVDRAGRVRVGADLSLPGAPEVFVAGDMCRFEQDGKPIPGVAPAAMQAGRHAAANILRQVEGKSTEPFRYVDKGSLATIGRAAAVAEVAGMRLSGLVAWLAWLAIHIFFLIGFRNRLLVLFQWAWAYVTHQRGARLITGDVAARVRQHGVGNREPGTEED
jgi:NADH dehydrogenase